SRVIPLVSASSSFMFFSFVVLFPSYSILRSFIHFLPFFKGGIGVVWIPKRMKEVARLLSRALSSQKESTNRRSPPLHNTKLWIKLMSSVESQSKGIVCSLGLLFVAVLHVDVAAEVWR